MVSGHSEHAVEPKSTDTMRVSFVILLNFFIASVELVAGTFAGSVSLISDAMHNFSDGFSVLLSFAALKLQSKKTDIRRTFGYKRSGIMAAFINSLILVLISLFLFKESYYKLASPSHINSVVVMATALFSTIINSFCAILLHGGSREDINIRSSYIHLLGDSLSSIGVVIGGVIIFFFGLTWVDPLLGILIGIYILKESFDILKKSTNILVEGAPEHMNIYDIVEKIRAVDGVKGVHHVHLWCLDEKSINFEAHVNVGNISVTETKDILDNITLELNQIGINHVTIQFEDNFCEDTRLIKS